jgi:ribonuclease D
MNLGSKTEKKRFQRYNWTQRPLSSEALQYAVGDVSYLFALKDRLLYQTVEAGLLDEFILKNLQIQNKPHIYEKLPGMLRSNRFRKLNAEIRERIQAYYWIRDEFARELNLPPNSVISNDQLFKLAQNQISVDDIRFTGQVPSEVQNILRGKIAQQR